jgi:hypothetical protein
MARRTIASARQAFDDLAPLLNPEMYRRLQSELKQASAEALTLATRYVDGSVTEALAAREDVLTEWCTVRDGYSSLATEAAAGRLTAREVNERLQGLRQQQRALDRHSAAIGQRVETVERIETDPEGWADETFYAKYQHMQPEFSF